METTTTGLRRRAEADGQEPLSARDIGIRSYVVRSGRMTAMQKAALEGLYERFGVRWDPNAKLGPMSLFGDEGPFIVEVGFGMGDATVRIAQALPASRFLGIEVHAPGVGKLLSELEIGRAHV